MEQTLMSLLEKRRSIRAFTSTPVTRGQADQLARAAQIAPSGRNAQTRQITVLQDAGRIAELAQLIMKHLPHLIQGEYKFFGAGTLILLSDLRDNALGQCDCACSLENVFLLAASMGLGACWVNQLRGICDEPAVRAALSDMGIPQDHLVWGMAVVGTPAEEAAPRQKESKVVFVP